MPVGAHDDQVGIEIRGLRQEQGADLHVVGLERGGLRGDPVPGEVQGDVRARHLSVPVEPGRGD